MSSLSVLVYCTYDRPNVGSYTLYKTPLIYKEVVATNYTLCIPVYINFFSPNKRAFANVAPNIARRYSRFFLGSFPFLFLALSIVVPISPIYVYTIDDKSKEAHPIKQRAKITIHTSVAVAYTAPLTP